MAHRTYNGATWTVIRHHVRERLKSVDMDTLGFEPRAFRMRSGCDTTTPCAHICMATLAYLFSDKCCQLAGAVRQCGSAARIAVFGRTSTATKAQPTTTHHDVSLSVIPNHRIRRRGSSALGYTGRRQPPRQYLYCHRRADSCRNLYCMRWWGGGRIPPQ